MTAAEIARELGYTDLFTVLAPTIYHCVPYDVLATLQEHFHGLIRLQLHQLPQELANLRLPELVVLTELRVPLMWFPLKPAVTGSARVGCVSLLCPKVSVNDSIIVGIYVSTR
jgi:hypothetical protein